jgi:hypothetical protein
MSRRKKTLISLLTLLVAACSFVCAGLWLFDDGPVSRSNFRRIQPGMDRDEVQSIMGGAGVPNDLGWTRHWGGDSLSPSSHWGETGNGGGEYEAWESNLHVISVWFDSQNRAREAEFFVIPVRDPSIWQRLRRFVMRG